MEGLYGSSNTNVLTFNFYAQWFNSRRNSPSIANGSRNAFALWSHLIGSSSEWGTEYISWYRSGFITEWKTKGKSILKPLTVDLQLLEHHVTLYLDLHCESLKIDNSQQSEAALQNCKQLLILEIVLLLGCDIEWAAAPPIKG
jgi:hypothetical protein